MNLRFDLLVAHYAFTGQATMRRRTAPAPSAAELSGILKRSMQGEPSGSLGADSQPRLAKLLKNDSKMFM